MNHDMPLSTIAEQYLAELEQAAAALPAGRRAELVSDVRSHIAVAHAEAQAVNPADSGDDRGVRETLTLLGTPQEIVAAALRSQPIDAPTAAASRGGSGTREGLALVLLLVGGLLFWFIPLFSWISWFTGLILLCSSRRWTVGDKLLGAAGVALAPMLLTGSLLAVGGETCTANSATSAVPGSQGAQSPAMVCTTTGVMPPALAIGLAVALLGAMVFAAARLARRAGLLAPSSV